MNKTYVIIAAVVVVMLFISLLLFYSQRNPVIKTTLQSTSKKAVTDSLSQVTKPVRSAVNMNKHVSDTQLDQTVEIGHTYWIDTKKEIRHNSTCRWYGHTKDGYYTDEKDGKKCYNCGG